VTLARWAAICACGRTTCHPWLTSGPHRGADAAVDDRAGDDVRKTKKLLNGCTDMATQRAKASAKAYKAGDHAPEGATSSVYASLFTSSSVATRQETYAARNLSFYR
jgi:hypothetical protein